MGSERAAAKLPEGIMSLVLTSQKACNNEPLGISKKEKHKLQEAKCSAFGHRSLFRMCAGTSFNSFILHHWKGKVDLMHISLAQQVLYFLYWNLRNLAYFLACQLAGGVAETSCCRWFPSGLGATISAWTPLSTRLSAVPNSGCLKEESGSYHIIQLVRNRFDLLDWNLCRPALCPHQIWSFLFHLSGYTHERRGLVTLEPWGLTLPDEDPGKGNGFL